MGKVCSLAVYTCLIAVETAGGGYLLGGLGGMRLTRCRRWWLPSHARSSRDCWSRRDWCGRTLQELSFGRSQQWLSRHPHNRRAIDTLGYVVRVLLSDRRIQDLDSSGHVRAYARAFRRLQPHRLVHPSSLTLTQIIVEPLFHKLRVLEGGRPLNPTGDILAVAQTAVTAVGDLHQMAQTLMPDIQAVGSSAAWLERANRDTADRGTAIPACCFLDLVLSRERPSDLNQTQPAVLWPYSVRSDGRLSSQDWCPHLESGGLEPRIVIPWDTARTWRPQAASLMAREEFYLLGPPRAYTVDPDYGALGDGRHISWSSGRPRLDWRHWKRPVRAFSPALQRPSDRPSGVAPRVP